MSTLLTIEDLATRWQTTIDRVRGRITQINFPAINIGTPKLPELRFRLAAVEEYEQRIECGAAHFLGGKEETVPSMLPEEEHKRRQQAAQSVADRVRAFNLGVDLGSAKALPYDHFGGY